MIATIAKTTIAKARKERSFPKSHGPTTGRGTRVPWSSDAKASPRLKIISDHASSTATIASSKREKRVSFPNSSTVSTVAAGAVAAEIQPRSTAISSGAPTDSNASATMIAVPIAAATEIQIIWRPDVFSTEAVSLPPSRKPIIISARFAISSKLLLIVGGMTPSMPSPMSTPQASSKVALGTKVRLPMASAASPSNSIHPIAISSSAISPVIIGPPLRTSRCRSRGLTPSALSTDYPAAKTGRRREPQCPSSSSNTPATGAAQCRQAAWSPSTTMPQVESSYQSRPINRSLQL